MLRNKNKFSFPKPSLGTQYDSIRCQAPSCVKTSEMLDIFSTPFKSPYLGRGSVFFTIGISLPLR